MLMVDSGGLLKVLGLRRHISPDLPPVTLDLHPERPIRRGIAPPPKKIPIIALPPDPTFAELEVAGGRVDLRDDDHEIIGRDGCSTGVGVSGEIKRVVPYEVGLPGAVTWMEENGEAGWFTDEVGHDPLTLDTADRPQQILDERYVVIEVKGKGLVIFSS